MAIDYFGDSSNESSSSVSTDHDEPHYDQLSFEEDNPS